MKRLLVVGFGDVARRAAPALSRRFALAPLSRSSGSDLDQPETLQIAAADCVLHLAPPPSAGEQDTRSANLLAALEKNGILPARFVYVSTSGVYGDCAGTRVDESRAVAPATPRARRRVDAEQRIAQWCLRHGCALVTLRVPGIYAAERLPLARLRSGVPVLRAEDDVYTNHIHADDLAAIVVHALEPGAPAGVYNASDDSDIKAADWMDLVADHAGLPRPARVERSRLREIAPADAYSFLCESRRLDNRRIKQALGVKLRFPTVREGLAHVHAARAE